MDIQLHFVEQGRGEALLLLHGNGEDGTYFKHQMDAFSARFRVLAVDTRGHGQSPRGSAPFTISQFADDLLDFMDGQHIKSAHILGFSDGANIALEFAMKHPGRVDRLILNGGNLFPGGVLRRYQWPIVLEYGLNCVLAQFSSRAKAKKELLGLMVNEPHWDPEALVRLYMPVLVIAGTKDMIAHEHTLLIHRSIPSSEIVFLPGGHFIARDTPEAFNQAVLNFLCPEEKSQEGA